MNKHAIFKKYCKHIKVRLIGNICGLQDEEYVLNYRKCLQKNCPFWKEIKR